MHKEKLRIAFISDIHGNLPALEAVFRSIASFEVDSVICLGDIVGYGARPNECVELLRQNSIPSILGNHDAAIIGSLPPSRMNTNARIAAEWTIANLNSDNRKFLQQLPMTMELQSILCVHSSPNAPDQWEYLFSPTEAATSFSAFTQSVCFFGHTHCPVLFTNPIDGRRLINVGSVGQPRDRDPRSCFGLYDTKSGSFRWIRVEYDFSEAARHIIEAGLPAYLAERLSSGS